MSIIINNSFHLCTALVSRVCDHSNGWASVLIVPTSNWPRNIYSDKPVMIILQKGIKFRKKKKRIRTYILTAFLQSSSSVSWPFTAQVTSSSIIILVKPWPGYVVQVPCPGNSRAQKRQNSWWYPGQGTDRIHLTYVWYPGPGHTRKLKVSWWFLGVSSPGNTLCFCCEG